MTVSSEVKRSDFSGNGSTTAFATGFRFLQNSDIKVILTVDSTGVETVQTEITNYTLTGAGLDDGGTVTMLVAPPTGTTLTIKRDVPLTQGTDYIENDDFPAESHEEALDKLTMIVQQIQEELDRSLKLSEAQLSSGLTLPVPVKDRFLQWDVNDDLQNVDILLQGALAVSDFAKTYLDDLTAAATRTTLDAMGRVSSGVTDNLVTLDSSDDAKDSGVAIESVPLDSVAGGTVDAITATFSPAFTALNDIKLIRVRAAGANATTTPTLAVDGLTAKTIVKEGNQALVIGDISGAGHELLFARNSTNDNYELLNPASADINLSNLSDTGNDKIVRAWVNFNGSGTVSIRDDFNVTSITDLGTGHYQVIFTTNLPSVNYTLSGSGMEGDGGVAADGTAIGPVSVATQLVNASQIFNYNIDSNTVVDGDLINVIYVGG